jgi:energy-coupling factor transporter ATP-binding protein EcfA2
VKLRRLTIAGFGRLAGRTFAFADGLNVIYGPNEAGKSTLAAAIVASLYGNGRRKDAWRPWDGSAYSTTLFYELSDGRAFEVQRDYLRDAKGVRVYDRDGNDVAADVAVGKTISPGDVHLQIPYDAFVNASCVLQQGVGIDPERNASIATALARALDGGPKEDAALGAVKRLEDARKTHVGTPRSTVNNPLRMKRDELVRREADATAVRTKRDDLAVLREKRAAVIADRDRVAERRADAERERKAIRAAELRTRLEQLHVYRDDLAALQAERASYDDVADFPADRITGLDAAFFDWRTAEGAALAAEADAAAAQLSVLERSELAARRADVGALDELEFAALRGAAEQAAIAHKAAAAAAGEAAAARRDGSGGRRLAGIAFAIAATFAALAIAMAIAHWWSFTEVFAAVMLVALAVVVWRGRDRIRKVRAAERKQKIADDALATERAATDTIASVLERFGATSIDDLALRRERYAELLRTKATAERAQARAQALREAERLAAATFDAYADALVGDTSGPRAERYAIGADRAQRRRKRDGVDNGIAMLALQRSEILRDDDEFALIAERDELARTGITPAETYSRALRDEIEAVHAEQDRLVREADLAIASLTGELNLGESSIGELAPIEEDVERLRAEVDRLEALDRALLLAGETVTRLTHEAHQAFARRLETYAAEALHTITGGRYGELRVDPTSFVVRARVPETGAIEDLSSLSAGTRDQVYLIIRIAMARMFAEGLELPPLLLDDPFAYWDETRIERCIPILAQNAFDAQTLLFTSSLDLAIAAERFGAARIDLLAGVPV